MQVCIYMCMYLSVCLSTYVYVCTCISVICAHTNNNVSSTHRLIRINLKIALRICASFRGCYLDYREKIEHFIKRYAFVHCTHFMKCFKIIHAHTSMYAGTHGHVLASTCSNAVTLHLYLSRLLTP